MDSKSVSRESSKQFVVWVQRNDGWFPKESMSKAEANSLASNLGRHGQAVRVEPRLTVTTADLIE